MGPSRPREASSKRGHGPLCLNLFELPCERVQRVYRRGEIRSVAVGHITQEKLRPRRSSVNDPMGEAKHTVIPRNFHALQVGHSPVGNLYLRQRPTSRPVLLDIARLPQEAGGRGAAQDRAYRQTCQLLHGGDRRM
jgi:hypothetical protein